MPTPRRRITLADPIASEPIISTSIHPPRDAAVRRCEMPDCDTILAADNHSTICSPCRIKDNGTPLYISEYLNRRR